MRTEQITCDRCGKKIPDDEVRTEWERKAVPSHVNHRTLAHVDLCANCDMLVVIEIRLGYERDKRIAAR